MERYRNNVQDGFGNAIPGVTVTVRLEATGVLASIFSDNLSTPTAKSNPFTNDSDGEFFFYALDERYDVFFTGPITDQIDDILLFDSVTPQFVDARTDINTATPPVAEAVTGAHQIKDNDGTDLLARLGYIASNVLQLDNLMRGGKVLHQVTDAVGNLRTILSANPDGQTILRADTDIRIQIKGGDNTMIGTQGVDCALFFNNIETFKTSNQTAADKISGAEVLDGEGNFQPVGLGASVDENISGTGTTTPFTQARAGKSLRFTPASATNVDTFASTGSSQTNIPNGAQWMGKHDGAGTLTFRGGASVTVRFWEGGDVTPPDVDVTIARGSVFYVKKVSDTIYDIWGNGATGP